jgi:tetratricopeptide (TPR) repeat protein
MTPWIQQFGWRYGLYYVAIGLLSLFALVSTLQRSLRTRGDDFHQKIGKALQQEADREETGPLPVVTALKPMRVLAPSLLAALFWTVLAVVSFARSRPAYYLYEAQTSAQGQDYDQAAHEFDCARQVYALAAQTEAGLQLAAARQNAHVDDALDEAAAQARLHLDSPAAHSDLGNLLMSRHQVEPALVEYRRALALKPDYALVHNNLGNALKAHHQPEQAIAEYRAAIALEPDNPVFHCSLARTYAARQALPEALHEYRKAVASGPDFLPSYLPLAVLLHRTDRREEACSTLQRLIERTGVDPAAAGFTRQLQQLLHDWKIQK